MLETGSSITNEHLEELQKKILKDPTYQGDIKLNNDTLMRVTRWLRDYHPTYLTQTFSAHFFHNVAQPKLSRYIKKNRFDLKLGIKERTRIWLRAVGKQTILALSNFKFMKTLFLKKGDNRMFRMIGKSDDLLYPEMIQSNMEKIRNILG